MKSQKRIKSIKQVSKDAIYLKERPKPSAKNSQSIHMRSASREVTPKKKSSQKAAEASWKKPSKNLTSQHSKSKHLNSVCSYTVFERQTLPTTKRKRKFSCIKSAEKRRTEESNICRVPSSSNFNKNLKITQKNFDVLAKCLSEFVKEERKQGKDPSKQILHFVKAFNKSEVGSVSKGLESLVGSMLDCIENNMREPDLVKAGHSASVDSMCENREEISSNGSSESSEGRQAYPPTIKKKPNFSMQRAKNEESIRASKSMVEEQLQKQLQRDVSEITKQLAELREANNRLHERSEQQDNSRMNLEAELEQQNKIMRFLNEKQRGERVKVSLGQSESSSLTH